MEKTKESAIQYALRRNQYICVHLSYPAIASHLIEKGVMTEEQRHQIEEQFAENTGRMNELISVILRINSEKSFNALRDSIFYSGELELEKKIQSDHNLHTDLNLLSSPIELQISNDFQPNHVSNWTTLPIEILNIIFNYLPTNDLLNVRLVSRTWNQVIIGFYIKRFRMEFDVADGHRKLIEFVSNGIRSDFCKGISTFIFATRTYMCVGVFYNAFFREFGVNIIQLELNEALDKKILCLVLSEHKHLQNLKTLYIDINRFANRWVFRSVYSWIEPDSQDLSQILDKCYNRGMIKSVDPYHSLVLFLKSGISLKSLTVCASYVPRAVFKELFKPGELEEIVLPCEGYVCASELVKFPHNPGVLKRIHAYMELGTWKEFKSFLQAHANTLEQATIHIGDEIPRWYQYLLEMPRLNCLKALRLVDFDAPYGLNIIKILAFCAQMPNLIKLVIECHPCVHRPEEGLLEPPPFKHLALRILKIKWRVDAMSRYDPCVPFFEQITTHFPNLIKLAVDECLFSPDFQMPNLVGERLIRATRKTSWKPKLKTREFTILIAAQIFKERLAIDGIPKLKTNCPIRVQYLKYT